MRKKNQWRITVQLPNGSWFRTESTPEKELAQPIDRESVIHALKYTLELLGGGETP